MEYIGYKFFHFRRFRAGEDGAENNIKNLFQIVDEEVKIPIIIIKGTIK